MFISRMAAVVGNSMLAAIRDNSRLAAVGRSIISEAVGWPQ